MSEPQIDLQKRKSYYNRLQQVFDVLGRYLERKKQEIRKASQRVDQVQSFTDDQNRSKTKQELRIKKIDQTLRDIALFNKEKREYEEHIELHDWTRKMLRESYKYHYVAKENKQQYDGELDRRLAEIEIALRQASQVYDQCVQKYAKRVLKRSIIRQITKTFLEFTLVALYDRLNMRRID